MDSPSLLLVDNMILRTMRAHAELREDAGGLAKSRYSSLVVSTYHLTGGLSLNFIHEQTQESHGRGK